MKPLDPDRFSTPARGVSAAGLAASHQALRAAAGLTGQLQEVRNQLAALAREVEVLSLRLDVHAHVTARGEDVVIACKREETKS